jgi:multimeric flavodoxin WrbA
MRVLGLLGAQREDGVTARTLHAVLDAVPAGNETEIIDLAALDIHPDRSGEPNPVLDDLERRMLAADVWVLAAPTYWGGLSGVMKHFLDCMRQRLVRFDHRGETHPDRFRGIHAVTITTCYTGALENTVMRVTDPPLRQLDAVLQAAGVIRTREIVVTGTWGMRKLPARKAAECARVGRAIPGMRRRDDETMRRYIQLFGMIAVMTLATMGLQRLLARLLPPEGFWAVFWGDYIVFTLVFFVLLSAILRWASVMRHRRR